MPLILDVWQIRGGDCSCRANMVGEGACSHMLHLVAVMGVRSVKINVAK